MRSNPAERILLVDDLIATGGTAEAAIRVIERIGGVVEACAFVIELPDLGGRSRVEIGRPPGSVDLLLRGGVRRPVRAPRWFR